MKSIIQSLACSALLIPLTTAADSAPPHIILIMSDDQGWGDVAYNGNPIVKTPHLDKMANEGIRLDRFYAATPVCSPTRGSCLTGRHPYRYGIEWAGEVGLPNEEVTLAESLASAGYATGHFGKWHIGQLSKTVKQTYFPGEKANPDHYSPPWENGYQVSFATAASVPTYNPYFHDSPELGQPGYKFIMDKPVTHGSTIGIRVRENYWTGPGQFVDENLAGEDSTIIMDRALDFIESHKDTPTFTTIWFHSPHTPIVAGDAMRALYPNESIERQHWFGCLSAIDQEVGRLRSRLRELKIADNTIVWFCSDNGPSYIHSHNSSGPFKGKKATLWEGGIRVPGIVEWPAKLKGNRVLNTPMSTSDFYPTLLAAAGVAHPQKQPPLDGINVLPILQGTQQKRANYIPFQAPVMNDKNVFAKKGSLQMCLQGDTYKLASFDGGNTWMLFNMDTDKEEQHNIADQHPEIVNKMADYLKSWRASCAQSAQGDDYQ
ncbi:sulfatase-like hydrolase/transferase [Rubritalea tangerina]|uniref:Sulfatase-like hydrolase/transferase n=1 Tax=Rubritalea tangerina TaxID=430798 RepID=A0ABW4ZE84_9BACT